ncbi:hypothetical protein GCK32_010502, partial [Trichostrongylus colubriformis]
LQICHKQRMNTACYVSSRKFLR